MLATMLAEAKDWQPGAFDSNIELWQECQGVVRFTLVHGLEKAGFLDKVP